jgi:hypothetical protein
LDTSLIQYVDVSTEKTWAVVFRKTHTVDFPHPYSP